jgi:ABC-type Fe3+/spermidine/putrescine transport system ATPase subunit
MDEPLGALDKNLRECMQLEIKQLQGQLKLTVLYVTHDQSEALTMSDRIAIMNSGRIEQLDTPTALYRSPVNRFVAQFVGKASLLDATATGVEDGNGRARIPGGAELQFPLSRAVAKGEAVTLMVRPEAIALGDAATALGNSVEGIVTRSSISSRPPSTDWTSAAGCSSKQSGRFITDWTNAARATVSWWVGGSRIHGFCRRRQWPTSRWFIAS